MYSLAYWIFANTLCGLPPRVRCVEPDAIEDVEFEEVAEPDDDRGEEAYCAPI